jgi:hypothetical protein
MHVENDGLGYLAHICIVSHRFLSSKFSSILANIRIRPGAVPQASRLCVLLVGCEEKSATYSAFNIASEGKTPARNCPREPGTLTVNEAVDAR